MPADKQARPRTNTSRKPPSTRPRLAIDALCGREPSNARLQLASNTLFQPARPPAHSTTPQDQGPAAPSSNARPPPLAAAMKPDPPPAVSVPAEGCAGPWPTERADRFFFGGLCHALGPCGARVRRMSVLRGKKRGASDRRHSRAWPRLPDTAARYDAGLQGAAPVHRLAGAGTWERKTGRLNGHRAIIYLDRVPPIALRLP